jgi:hypothetical protein
MIGDASMVPRSPRDLSPASTGQTPTFLHSVVSCSNPADHIVPCNPSTLDATRNWPRSSGNRRSGFTAICIALPEILQIAAGETPGNGAATRTFVIGAGGIQAPLTRRIRFERWKSVG